MSAVLDAPVRIVIACEAGVASSVLLSTQLIKRLRGLDVQVRFASVDSLPSGVDVVLAHRHLAHRLPDVAEHTRVVVFDQFVGDPAIEQVVAELRTPASPAG